MLFVLFRRDKLIVGVSVKFLRGTSQNGDRMTLCVAVKCEDGILIASDSRTVYGRGVPISRRI